MSRAEFRESDMAINDYRYNTEPDSFEAIVILKAQGSKGILRVFFLFDDGRQVIAPVYSWQRYLSFYEIPLGSRVRLTYEGTAHGTFLKEAEVL